MRFLSGDLMQLTRSIVHETKPSISHPSTLVLPVCWGSVWYWLKLFLYENFLNFRKGDDWGGKWRQMPFPMWDKLCPSVPLPRVHPSIAAAELGTEVSWNERTLPTKCIMHWGVRGVRNKDGRKACRHSRVVAPINPQERGSEPVSVLLSDSAVAGLNLQRLRTSKSVPTSDEVRLLGWLKISS